MRKVLKNTPKTKAYLNSLPKVYGIFLWAKWGILELRWSGKCDKSGMPLVYDYYDANGTCDEYHLRPINKCSSGCFLGWYTNWDHAKMVRNALNETLKRDKLTMTNLQNIKNMDVDQFADWLDKNSCCDDAPWSDSFNKEYCQKCEAIKCAYADAEEKLGIQTFSYSGNVDCAYCEVYGKCKFFPELDDIPSNKDIIKMWLEGEAE